MNFSNSSSKRIKLILTAAILLATIPRLIINYGMDGDATRSALAAENLFRTGSYLPSRLPGNPLFEYMLSLIVPWSGHFGSNLSVFFFYILSLWAFSILANTRKSAGLLKVTYALTPAILLNSATTMDYIPGLAFLLLALVCVSKFHPFWGSILLGISIGFRISNALFALPLAMFQLKRLKKRKVSLYFLLSILVGLAFYIPILNKSGLSAFSIAESAPEPITYLVHTTYRSLMLFGPVATAGIAIIVFLNRKNIRSSFKTSLEENPPWLLLEISSVILFTVLFLYHSDETAYLLPAVPFVLLLLSRWLPKAQLMIAACLILSFSLVSVELKGGQSGRRSLTFRLSHGCLVKDYLERKEIESLKNALGSFQYSAKAVILTGMGPILTFQNPHLKECSDEIVPLLLNDGSWNEREIHRIKGSEVYLFYSLSKENVELLKAQGFKIFVFSAYAPSIAMINYGYAPEEVGIEKLEVLNQNAFYKQ